MKNLVYDIDINALYPHVFSHGTETVKWYYEEGSRFRMFYRGGCWCLTWNWITSDIELALSLAKSYIEEAGMDVKEERSVSEGDPMHTRKSTTVRFRFRSDADALQFKLAVLDADL